MNTCGNCGERIPFKSLVRTIVPIWVTCRNCHTKLVGNPYVQVQALTQAVLASMILLVPVTWVLMSYFLSRPRTFTADAAEALLTAAGILAAIWLAGILLIWRFGRYSSGPDTQPLVLRKYWLATAGASVIVLSWAGIYAGINTVSPVILLAWAFVPVLVLLPVSYLRKALPARNGKEAGHLLWAGGINN
ncbi:MAG: hypothetical protein IH962_03005 [Chloroflexi bacterium]|nr:hypothetical protein [Chloroflexota bacterium]